jgi:uncharacterized membrane protein YwaF
VRIRIPRKAAALLILLAALVLALWLGALETTPWRTPFPVSLCPWLGYCM